MFPAHFADLLKQWLTDAHHPGIAQVRACAEIGRWEQPVGVAITLSDGWRVVLQTVGGAPPGGFANANPDRSKPAPFAGMWDDRGDYQTARKVDEAAARAHNGPRSQKPAATADAIMAVVVDAIRAAAHPEIVTVELVRRAADRPENLRVTCDDQSMIYGYLVGYMPPGAADYNHPAHQVPKEYQDVSRLRSVDRKGAGGADRPALGAGKPREVSRIR